MKSRCLHILLLCCFVTMASCQKDDGITFLDEMSAQKAISKSNFFISYDDSLALETAINACASSTNRNVSIGVFGGSLSCRGESVFAKSLWIRYLNANVFTYGVGGSGFSSLQGGVNSIQHQVDKAKPHDIYILWASTNDFTNHRPIGPIDAYTEADGYDPASLTTQCGGMNYCIQHLRKVNPKARIYIFTSLPFYEHEGGYNPTNHKYTNDQGSTFFEYIEAQKQVAQLNGVKCFNQFAIPVLSMERSSRYYVEDGYHMTAEGYANIGVFQLYFLATETEMPIH